MPKRINMNEYIKRTSRKSVWLIPDDWFCSFLIVEESLQIMRFSYMCRFFCFQLIYHHFNGLCRINHLLKADNQINANIIKGRINLNK
jgi:hypothetical protein